MERHTEQGVEFDVVEFVFDIIARNSELDTQEAAISETLKSACKTASAIMRGKRQRVLSYRNEKRLRLECPHVVGERIKSSVTCLACGSLIHRGDGSPTGYRTTTPEEIKDWIEYFGVDPRKTFVKEGVEL